MKLLFDQNISFRLVKKIQDIFPEAEQVRNLGLENTADREIWNYARENDFVILTFDADFIDLSILEGPPPKVILIRTLNQKTSNIERLLRENIELIKSFCEELKTPILEIPDNTIKIYL